MVATRHHCPPLSIPPLHYGIVTALPPLSPPADRKQAVELRQGRGSCGLSECSPTQAPSSPFSSRCEGRISLTRLATHSAPSPFS